MVDLVADDLGWIRRFHLTFGVYILSVLSCFRTAVRIRLW
jgi:hypothetical protein